MTSKKSKGSKSESRSKKRSHNASPNSSTIPDDKKDSQADLLASETALQISTEELSLDTHDAPIAEPMTESLVFIDEPTLTELIIEKYEGEKANGRFEGYGTAYFVNGNIYEGTFSEGAMHGSGRFYWKAEETFYEGDFYFNEISGKGKFTWVNDGSSYEGDVIHGVRNGQGTYKHPSGKIYSGSWVNGKRHGMGIMHYDMEEKSFYDGEWNQNVIEGIGFRQYPSGNTYEGEWYKGKRHGHGTMKWLDRNEQYTGQWKNGVQNGSGQHIWFVQRIKGSQYSQRNIYEGDFVNGKRHGYGNFIYPSGAQYRGKWKNNRKCGLGEFLFKNGRSYMGEFEDDKVKEFPLVSLTGRDSPDLNLSKTHQSMLDDIDNLSARLSVCSFNTVSPSFKLYLDHLLMDPQISNPEEETIQIQKAVLLHLGPIRKIYQFYSILGDNGSVDNTFALNQMQFWRFQKDCRLHYNSGPTIAELDRFLTESVNYSSMDIIQNPTEGIILLSFINYLISIAYYVYAKNYKNYEDVSGNLLVKCFEDLMNKNILPYACNIGGMLYVNKRKTDEALTYFHQLFDIYKEFSYPRKDFPNYYSMKMRDFLVMMKKLGLLNSDLSATEIVKILALDDPNVTDGQFVCLENEITFYEFYEAIIGCATVFVTKDVIDFHLRLDDKKSSSLNATVPSENVEDSETEHTLSVSRPITGDSYKLEHQDDDKINTRNQGKPQSGKNKSSSAESNNYKNRKADIDKNPTPKKPNKSSKSPKNTNTRSRKMSVDKESQHLTKSPAITSDAEKLINIAEVITKEDDYGAEDSSSPVKTPGQETESQELNEERSFNFWTHQLHIFFYSYLFPAVTKYSLITKRIEDEILKDKFNTCEISNNQRDTNINVEQI